MGIPPPTPAKNPPNQVKILQQAAKISQQLELFQTDSEHREQRHLFARILIYGHSNLLEQLRKFSKERQREIVRDLKMVDYETTDLLYQNLVLKKMKESHIKMLYQEYLGYIYKNKEKSDNPTAYKAAIEAGSQAILNKKVAILLFVGGQSTRFKDKNGKPVPKELYVNGQGRKCLLQIALQKVQQKQKAYNEIPLYLVHNEKNHKQLNTILQKFPTLRVKKLLQHENPIVNLSGHLCLKNHSDFQIITLPRGCGDLSSLSVRGTKLLEEMKQNGVEFVCALGVENICANVCDPYLVGLLRNNQNASVSFKCTYPDNEGENLKRVIFNKTKKRLQATELQTLLEIGDKNSHPAIKKSPVWMNNLVFRLTHIQQYLDKKKQNFNVPQVFTAKKIQCTYWNPSSSSLLQNQHCYFFERELNTLLLNEDLTPLGVMVEREGQFVPVISLDEEWTWEDAYNQYQYYRDRERERDGKKGTAGGMYRSVIKLGEQEKSEF